MPLKTIIANLGSLSPNELRTVKAAVDHLLSGTDNEKIEDDLQLFYGQLARHTEQRGVSLTPWPVLIKRAIFRDYQKSFGNLQKYTLKYFGKLNRLHRQRLYNIYAGVLINWIDESPLPLLTNIVIRTLDNIPALMSKSYPGYVESGLLHLILKQQQTTRGEHGE